MYKNMQSKIKAFTLVELIVVVTILAILGTIGFVSYSSYLGSVRDANRTASLWAISDGLQLYSRKQRLLIPDNAVSIISGSKTIGYQGYAWETVLEIIDYSKDWLDPADDIHFTYYLTANKKYHQLMAFLEESWNIQAYNLLFSQANAADLTIRYPTVYGKKLWILLDSSNTPIQELTFVNNEVLLSTTNSGDSYTAYLSDTQTIEDTGGALAGPLTTISESWARFWFPIWRCPSWFIPVSWNIDLFQPGFCVAKYEMTYVDATTANSSLWWTDRNTHVYDIAKTPMSKQGLYPVTEITIIEALAQCQKMWAGYHLITENEWMTIARNIEANGSNWSNGTPWDGIVYNGVSGNTTYGCDAKGWNSGETRTYGTITWSPNCLKDWNNANKHTLSNGEEIWDLAGNVWELVNRNNNIYATTTAEIEWEGDLCGVNGLWAAVWDPATSCADEYGPVNSGWWANLWLWLVNNSTGTNKVFGRWRDASSSVNSGIFSLLMSWTSWSNARNVGFRCAK